MTLRLPNHININSYTEKLAYSDFKISLKYHDYLFEELLNKAIFSNVCFWFILRFNI